MERRNGAVPTIDISDAVAGRNLQELARELGAASRTVGFVQIIGHGIDPATFRSVYEASDALWAMPDSALDALASPVGHPFRGVDYGRDEHGERIWQRLQNTVHDTPEEAAAAGNPTEYLDFFVGNLHPEIPELTSALDVCFAAGRRLGSLLMRLFAIDLGLGADGFAAHFERDVSYMAVQDYPAMSHPAPSGVRIPEHSDSGALTMLHQGAGYEGLQLTMTGGQRLVVPVVDEAIVVNTGDLLARWTNDLFRATPHAVIDGPVGEGRRTIATHYLPNVETVIAPLDACLVGEGPRYPPVRMYDWDRRYFEKRSLVLSLADEV